MEAKGIRLQGELGISRQTIAQGMPACLGCTCMLVCTSLTNIAHETVGAASTRHSLHPLVGGKVHANLGRNASREREHTFSRHRPRRRTIQYSRDASDGIEKPRRTGYPACAGYDDRVQRCDLYVIASAAKQSSLSLCRVVDCFAALAMTRIGRDALDTPHV